MKQNPVTIELAMKWQAQLIERWLDKRIEPFHVFAAVERKRDVEDLLTSPYLTIWTKYLAEYNKANSGKQKNEISVILKRYTEEDVVKMLKARRKVKVTEALATEWQEQLMQKWVDWKRNLGTVSKYLNVDHNQEDTLTNWSTYLQVWSRYVDDVNGRNRDDEMEKIVDVLRTKFDDHIDGYESCYGCTGNDMAGADDKALGEREI